MGHFTQDCAIHGCASQFAGKHALVVGGSGGIGAAISLQLAARGAQLIVHGRNAAKVDAIVARINAHRSKDGATVCQARGLVVDITKPQDISAILESLDKDRLPDILVVAFGPFVQKSLAETSVEEWERMASLNLGLPGALASALLPHMLQQKWGRLLFLGGSRTDVLRAYRSNAAYAAAKTGLAVLTKSLALEGAEHNVAALTVCPGIVDTEYYSPDARIKLASKAPAGRLICPDEIAQAALNLLDADPCIASGAIVSLDAGFDTGRSAALQYI